MAFLPPGPAHDGPVLVIGFGNVLRSDDGVGPRIADAVAGWDFPGVVALAVHQLLPELAESLSDARLAIFVDADFSNPGEATLVTPLLPRSTASPIGHTSDPAQLLALARDLFGRAPAACLVRVPVRDLGLGESLSPLAEAGASQALHRIAHLLADHGIPLDPVASPGTQRPALGPPPPISWDEGSREQEISR
jgi:hydrogenase maturation protease